MVHPRNNHPIVTAGRLILSLKVTSLTSAPYLKMYTSYHPEAVLKVWHLLYTVWSYTNW